MNEIKDAIVISDGQSGLACGYYLRRIKANFLLLDKKEQRGGAWLYTWDSLTIFSPAQYSSLPGWLKPKSRNPFLIIQEVIDYLRKYEKRYDLPIKRPVSVHNIIF